jgi:anti-anti-sigma factor
MKHRRIQQQPDRRHAERRLGARAPRLRELFSARSSAHGEAGEVLLDLTQVTFLDSAVLGVVGLIRRVREADASSGVLPRGTALRIFQITGLDTILRRIPRAPLRWAAEPPGGQVAFGQFGRIDIRCVPSVTAKAASRARGALLLLVRARSRPRHRGCTPEMRRRRSTADARRTYG